MDIADFLRARLDEDFEAVGVVLGVNVMAAIQDGKPAPRWVPSPKGDAGIWDTNGVPRVKYAWARERDHIIRHDPARVLAEVEAKRQILDDLLAEPHTEVEDPFYSCAVVARGDEARFGGPCDCGRDERLNRRLSLLALPYAHHPDHREDWRP